MHFDTKSKIVKMNSHFKKITFCFFLFLLYMVSVASGLIALVIILKCLATTCAILPYG